MIEIQIPKTIKIGGFDYKVEVSSETDESLVDDQLFGEHSGRLRRISVQSTLPPQQFSKVIMHEFLHAINDIYALRKLDEDMVQALSNGLLQVMEQLGVRFVKRA